MEWVITFTIVGLYGCQLFLICAEYVKPTQPQPRPRGGFTRRSGMLTREQVDVLVQIVNERKRFGNEKVNWIEEGF